MYKETIKRIIFLITAVVVLIGVCALLSERSYAASERIDSVKISVTKPTAGKDCEELKPQITADKSSYIIEACGWISPDGKQEPPTYFKFEAGKKYSIWVTLKASSGFYFPDDLSEAAIGVSGGTLKQLVDIYTYGDYSALVLNLEVECAGESAKSANPITVKAKTAKISYSKLKKTDQTLAVSKVLIVKNAVGAVAYTKLSGNKKITINKTTGKVKIKKGLKKNSYKIKVKVAAEGNDQYAAGSKTKTFTIKVK